MQHENGKSSHQIERVREFADDGADADDDLVAMCVVYARRHGLLKFPDNAVAAFRDWDEADEYRKRHFPDGTVFRQALGGDEADLMYRVVGDDGRAERVTDYCRFCYRHIGEVAVLIKGKVVAICDSCVDECVPIVAEYRARERGEE